MPRRSIVLILSLVFVFISMNIRAAAADLFFSEYIEGSNDNKALEIYNGTEAAVNLGNYLIEIYPDGISGIPAITINLGGTLASGDVYVVADSGASAAVLAQADLLATTLFDGNDAIVLRKSGTGNRDVIGRVGQDPGTEWGSGLTSTSDNTLIRKPAICAGDPIQTDAFDPAVQWDGFAVDSFDNLGTHTSDCLPASTTTSTPQPTDTPVSSTPSGETPTPPFTATPGSETETPASTPTQGGTQTESTATPNVTETPDITTPQPTATVVNGVQLLVNGGMEADTDNDKQPDDWQIKNSTKDQRKCNKDKDGDGIPDKIFAHNGVCAFRFKGDVGETSKLFQTVDPTAFPFSAGDTLNLSVFVNAGNSAVKGKLKVRVKYTDAEKGKITENLAQTEGYEEMTGALTIASASISKIKVQISHSSSAGKLYIDDASLLWVTSSALPLS
jgi:predicted extracellular nuclease